MKTEIKPKNLLTIYKNYKLKLLRVNLGLDFFLLKYIFETLFED